MIDAYTVQEQVKKYWSELYRPTSGDSLKREYPTVPVYVLVDQKLSEVKEVYLDSGRIILRA